MIWMVLLQYLYDFCSSPCSRRPGSATICGENTFWLRLCRAVSFSLLRGVVCFPVKGQGEEKTQTKHACKMGNTMESKDELHKALRLLSENKHIIIEQDDTTGFGSCQASKYKDRYFL